MVAYHPDSRFLTDYASANLPLSEALCVSAHIEFCGKCRAHVKQLVDVGAALMELSSSEPLADESFEQALAKIDSVSPGATSSLKDDVAAAPSGDAVGNRVSPRGLRGVLGVGFENLNWVQLGPQLRVAPIGVDAGSRETAIYDIKAGGKLPEHGHAGEEITVLLEGSFSDAEGNYSLGDFVVRNVGEVHQPTVTQDKGCVCLVSLEQPVKPQFWLYRLLAPYVQYRLNRAVNS